MRVALAEFAEWLNKTAVETISQDGRHSGMFFVLTRDGRAEPRLFSAADRPVAERWGREIADAAVSIDAEGVAFVAEGSVALTEDRDLLLVAAIDRAGQTVVFETPISRRADGTVEPGESRRYSSGYHVAVFDAVRAAWGLRRRRDLGFGVSAEVPDDWRVEQADRVIELLPPSAKASAHISVFRRRTPEPVKAGDACSFVDRFPAWRTGHDRVGPTEHEEGEELVATASCVDKDRPARWEIGARVGPSHALVFSYNDDGSEDELLETARAIFASIRRVGTEPAK